MAPLSALLLHGLAHTQTRTKASSGEKNASENRYAASNAIFLALWLGCALSTLNIIVALRIWDSSGAELFGDAPPIPQPFLGLFLLISVVTCLVPTCVISCFAFAKP